MGRRRYSSTHSSSSSISPAIWGHMCRRNLLWARSSNPTGHARRSSSQEVHGRQVAHLLVGPWRSCGPREAVCKLGPPVDTWAQAAGTWAQAVDMPQAALGTAAAWRAEVRRGHWEQTTCCRLVLVVVTEQLRTCRLPVFRPQPAAVHQPGAGEGPADRGQVRAPRGGLGGAEAVRRR